MAPGCLGLLLVLSLSAAKAISNPSSFSDDLVEEISPQQPLALPSEGSLIDEIVAFEEREGENLHTPVETDEASLEALVTQIEYLNEFHGPLKKNCSKGEGIYKIQSEFHGSYYRDRRWNFECKKVVHNNTQVNCTQTQSYVNELNGPIVFTCGDNEYLAGVESYHEKVEEDRRWMFTCCSALNHTTSDCRLSEEANKLGQAMEFRAGDGQIITGVDSPMDSTEPKKDRIWKYLVCKYKSSQTQYAPPLGLDDIYIKTFTLALDGSRNLTLTTQDGVTATIPIKNAAIPRMSSNKLLVYRPNYSDLHRSGLAGIFVNIENVFPCIAKTHYVPICSVFTSEEDGFRKGKQYIQLGDLGNNVKVFGKRIATYGLAVSGCSLLNERCLPSWVKSTVMCLLPRSSCQSKI